MSSRNLLVLLTLCVTTLQSTYSQTFHAIIIANTECPGDPNEPGSTGIGPSVTCDYQRMKIEFETMASFLGYQKDFKICEGAPNRFCRNGLESALNSLQCGKDDIVFFYYSGHGARSPKDKTDPFPNMHLLVDPFRGSWNDEQFVPLSLVLNRIKAKKPRLVIVMGDLCNSFLNDVPYKEDASSKGATKIAKAPCDFYRDLFLKIKGHIIASSSKPGETSAACEDGGAFTLAFTNALQQMVSKNMEPDWEILLEGSKKITQSMTGSKQTPVFEINVIPANAVQTNNIVDNPEPAPIITGTSDIEDCLTAIGSSDTPIKERIKLINPTLSRFFSSPHTKIEIIGKDGKSIVGTKYAETYLNNLSIARNLIKVIKVNQSENQDGKLTYLKVHEMYK